MIPSPRIDLSIDTKTLHGYVKRKDVDELRKFISNKNDLMLDGLKGKKGLSALHVATIEVSSLLTLKKHIISKILGKFRIILNVRGFFWILEQISILKINFKQDLFIMLHHLYFFNSIRANCSIVLNQTQYNRGELIF